MIEITIRIDGEGLDPEAVREWLGIPKLLRKIKNHVDEIKAAQEKLMADLQAEFAAFNTELTRLLSEVNTEIQQLADAFAAGNVSAQVVEDARGRIVAATEAAKAAADALAADNPPPAP